MENKVYYGLFVLKHKTPPIINYATASSTSFNATFAKNEIEIVSAYDSVLETEEEAKKVMQTLPKPAAYIILPVYFLND